MVHLLLLTNLSGWLIIMTIGRIVYNQTEAQQARSANQRTHLSESEMLDILELARKTNARDWAILVVAFHHGLRVTEVLELEIEGSINWRDRTLTVKRLKGSLTTTQPLVEIRGKPALSELAALKAYFKVRVEDGSGHLFTGQKGPLRRWTLTRMFRKYCELVSAARVAKGLAPIVRNAMHFHSIKHSIATILASRVDNIFLVKTHLGHAAISSTMHYCHPNQKLAALKTKEVIMRVFSAT
jgi:type 1 fimbriae regulatory protein FimB